ncbi:MAG TPA: lysophospholipid acyltransferase family protein [Rectinemataceae bacterium]
MISARRYTPTNSRFFTWLLRNTYGRLLRKAYRAEAEGLDLIQRLEPPYIVVGNHTMLQDAFLANAFVPKPIHWVASDGNMRNPMMRFLLIKLVGSIPKSKAIPDIETVNWIVEFIRKRKGVVGFYPEGQATWNGSSLPAFGSTAKLIKLLKAPVVLALSKGGYMTKPRWAYNLRPGGMSISFSLLFEPGELKILSVEQIDKKLNEAIAHDDYAWARSVSRSFEDPRRAECLELALYACPDCGSLQSLKSRGARLTCLQCGAEHEYGTDGAFARIAQARPDAAAFGLVPKVGSNPILEMSAWDAWQEAYLERLIESVFLPDPRIAIFQDDGVRFLKGKRMDTMKSLGTGRLILTSKALRFEPGRGAALEFPVEGIEGPGVLKWNHFEFYIGKTVYRARFANRAASGRKYAVACGILGRRLRPAG